MSATLAPVTAFTAALATLPPIRRAHAALHAASPWPWNASELFDGWWLDGCAAVREGDAPVGNESPF